MSPLRLDCQVTSQPFEVTADLVADAILAADAVGRASQAAP
jgi:hypothetical protein